MGANVATFISPRSVARASVILLAVFGAMDLLDPSQRDVMAWIQVVVGTGVVACADTGRLSAIYAVVVRASYLALVSVMAIVSLHAGSNALYAFVAIVGLSACVLNAIAEVRPSRRSAL
jgi:hypothetical protein